ncbi:hypothetical protein [Kluyvera ascorbata]|uniref:hypothetical protein n=1 Tax=Kluyvera ascorbata TaxID=51288 RepID=UPI00055A523F|nr:hypothetical protein [Kluyvera ascorbata]MDU1198799.1 hypothetical protein [Kluyvera ascorbata]STW98019.1 Uncharacterised protein [Kluyvera ascorbata]BCA38766.1 hypothetical protein KATP_12880 [Kluyvera ascorbata]HBL0733465.1 hypothetical protein [Kluyvera ascorbata]HBL0735621.1 hypothetical protein [Kluyvera ascorbata]
MNNMDGVTKMLLKAVNILLFSYPKRTSFGLLIGFILAVILYTIRTLSSVYSDVIGWMHYLGAEFLGVLGMNTKSIIESYKGDAIDESFGYLLKSIETNTNLTEENKRLLIIELLHKQIQSLSDKQVQEVEEQVIDK